MTIIVFLVDTSASMNQRTAMGTTFLDIAKHTVEMFLKIRSRDPVCRLDRYMLLTFEEPPMNVKAGWKESHCTFMKELKSLEAGGLSNLGSALKNTFDMLNTNRLQTGIDTFGQGRFPFYIEPAIIICLTDGNKMTSKSGATNELNLPMNAAALLGSELTKEPFRWDQRLYSIVCKVSSLVLEQIEPLSYVPTTEESPIDAMCEVTGGRSYSITTQKSLVQCLESLAQKLQSGVIVNFEKLPPEFPVSNGIDDNYQDQIQPWHNCRKLLFVNRSAQRGGTTGHWPIPECYWPDVNKEALPPRSAHPVISFSCRPCEPLTLDNFPFDKYELEASPLTQHILERRQPHVAWQVFVKSSSKYSELGYPFGYLKASTNLNVVNMFVMPYNYPLLFSLLDELVKVNKFKIIPKWKMQFEGYLKSVPPYYATPLKKALGRLSLPPNMNLIPDQMENCFSYSVVSYLKKIKNQARIEFERLVASVGQCPPPAPTIRVMPRTPHMSLLDRPDAGRLMAQYGDDICGLKQELSLSVDTYDMFTIHADPKIVDAHIYTNPFDVNHKDLVLNLSRMRLNFLKSTQCKKKLQHTEALHNMPIQEMGNYQEYLKKQTAPLREIETTPTRIHTFGNPFKVKQNLMIDEADEAMLSQSSSPSSSLRKKSSESSSSPSSPIPSTRSNKRKPGPLPRNVPAKYFLMQSLSTPNSPVSAASLTIPSIASGAGKSVVLVNSSDRDLSNNVSYDETSLVNHVTSKKKKSVVNSNGVVDLLSTNHVENDSDVENVITNGDNDIQIKTNNPQRHVWRDEKVDKEYNDGVKKRVITEVKKPGRNYSGIISMLSSLRGSAHLRRVIIDRVLFEAKRFKRSGLAKVLEELSSGLS